MKSCERRSTSSLSPEQLRKFHTKGFLVLDGMLPQQLLDALCAECECLLRIYERHSAIVQDAGCILEPLGARVTGKPINNEGLTRDSYLNERSKFNNPRVGDDFVFGPLLRDILEQLMGKDLYLFNEQYIVKTPHAGDESKFVMHQDSQYVHELKQEEVPPYVSVWCALDDMSEENGCLYILPYPSNPTFSNDDLCFPSPERLTRHHLALTKDYPSGLLGGSSEVRGELPVLVDKGSIVLLSSLVYHRSGANISEEPRRAYMPQFSWGPIRCAATQEEGRQAMRNVALAVPLSPEPTTKFGV